MTKPSLMEQLSNAPSGQLAEMYVEARRQRDAHRRLDKKWGAKMEFIGRFIRARMAKEKTDGFNAIGHTVYTYTLNTARVIDPEAFIKHIQETQDFSLIERRASQEACSLYQDEVGEPPPGVMLEGIEKLGVRKGKSKR